MLPQLVPSCGTSVGELLGGEAEILLLLLFRAFILLMGLIELSDDARDDFLFTFARAFRSGVRSWSVECELGGAADMMMMVDDVEVG